MSNIEKNTKVINALIWLGLCIMVSYGQFIMFALGVMVTDAGVPEPSLMGTIEAIPFTLIIAIPSFIPLIFSIISYVKKKQFLLILILNILISLLIIDMSMGSFGGYSLTDKIGEAIHLKKQSYVTKNHPRNNTESKLLYESSHMSLYLEEDTKNVLMVTSTKIEKLNKWATREEDIPLMRGYMNEIPVEVVQLYNWDTSIGKVTKDAIFSIPRVSMTYSMDEDMFHWRNIMVSDIEPIDFMDIEKNGSTISFE